MCPMTRSGRPEKYRVEAMTPSKLMVSDVLVILDASCPGPGRPEMVVTARAPLQEALAGEIAPTRHSAVRTGMNPIRRPVSC